jgi:hypothetical protein
MSTLSLKSCRYVENINYNAQQDDIVIYGGVVSCLRHTRWPAFCCQVQIDTSFFDTFSALALACFARSDVDRTMLFIVVLVGVGVGSAVGGGGSKAEAGFGSSTLRFLFGERSVDEGLA